jgi:hypothetical protein
MSEPLEAFLENVPDPAEVRRRIAENLKERNLLRRVLKLAEKRAAVSFSRGSKQEAAR